MDCADEVVANLLWHNFAGSPFNTDERTTLQGGRLWIERPCTYTDGCTPPYFREAGNKYNEYQNPI